MVFSTAAVPNGGTAPGHGARLATKGADLAALALLAYLVYRIFFDLDKSFDLLGSVVAAAGLLAARAAKARLGTFLDWPVLAYGVLTVLSVVAGRHRYAAGALAADSFEVWRPAVHTAALVAYFYAAVWILRTERRLRAFAVAMVLAVSILGLQAAYDHAHYGFDTRLDTYPSTPQWLGYPELGLLFALAFPFPLALMVVSGSAGAALAALVVATVLWLDEVWLYSRGGYAGIFAAYVALAAIELASLRRARLLAALSVFIIVAGVSVMASARLHGVFAELGGSYVYSSRFDIWHRTLRMIGDHPWFGVGPGNYVSAMQTGYEWRTWSHADDTHAHNLLLHVAAESGIPAAAAFLTVWLTLFTRLWRAPIARAASGAATMGIFGALVAFFVRGLTDHFLAGLDTSDRLAFLLWTLIAAGVAAARLARAPQPSEAQPSR
jgi:O-antigen ligase